MTPFDFQLRTRIIAGEGVVDRLGEVAGELGARRALLVSDPGIVAAGHVDRALQGLTRAGIETHVLTDVQENPTDRDVDRGVVLARRYEPELLIGLGGGSSMDCAKGVNFVYSNGGKIADYWGIGKALRPMLPMIAVPTTAGTGSETQSFALISDSKTHVKMACGDKKASFRVALLDPQLTCTMPPMVTALGGIDALAHALETCVTTKRSECSRLFSREAWRLLSANFARVLQSPGNVESRAAMQLGSCLAGVAIENSMLGAAHALANPLTANYGVAHGQAVAVMLPHVIRFNGVVVDSLYADLVAATEVELPAAETAAGRLSEFVLQQLALAGLQTNLRGCGVSADRLPELAEQALTQWTGTFNPRPLTTATLEFLYREAY